MVSSGEAEVVPVMDPSVGPMVAVALVIGCDRMPWVVFNS